MRISTIKLPVAAGSGAVDWRKLKWLDIGSARPTITVEILGLGSGDVVQVYVSDYVPSQPAYANSNPVALDGAPPAPATAANSGSEYVGQKFGPDVTANGMVKITESYRWLALIQTAFAGGGIPTASVHIQIQDDQWR